MMNDWRLFTVRCILLDAVYVVKCILLDTLATFIYFVEHTGNCQHILLDTMATVMDLLDTCDISLVYSVGRCCLRCVLLDTLATVMYFVEHTDNCHTFS